LDLIKLKTLLLKAVNASWTLDFRPTLNHPWLRKSIWLGLFLAGNLSSISAATYYVDAVNGNDSSSQGTSAKPYKTLTKVMTVLASGDTVLLNSGTYATFVVGRTNEPNVGNRAINLFTNWVTFKAAPGQSPHINQLDIGSLNYIGSSGNLVKLDIGRDNPQGNANHYLRFESLTIDDGVSIEGSRYIQVTNCTVKRLGALNGSVDNIENKPGIDSQYGAHLAFESNEVTHASTGIAVAGSDTIIRNNNIHHNSHDGIHVLGGPDWLIEGNCIHDLDDGADDWAQSLSPGDPGYDARRDRSSSSYDETADPAWDASANQSWNRHVDGIQIYDLNGDGSDAVTNLTIRRNLFYHLECMGMMLQCKTDSIPDSDLVPPRRFTNWVIEDNVFGPCGSQAIILGVDIHGGFVLRHNTVLHAPNDSWTSLFRAMPAPSSTSYIIQMWADTTLPEFMGILKEYRVYNNIFGDAGFGYSYTTFTNMYGYVGGNLFYGSGNALGKGDRWYTTQPYETIPGNIQAWLDAGHLPGQLLAGSAAVDAGSMAYVNEAPDDFRGLPRDAKPDIGACEYAAPGSYLAWVITNGLSGSAALRMSDPDGDGWVNLLEFALGSPPANPATAPYVPAATGTNYSGVSSLAFRHRLNQTANLTWSYEVSTNLTTWQTTTLTNSVLNADADGNGRVEIVQVLLPITNSQPKQFLRFGVKEP